MPRAKTLLKKTAKAKKAVQKRSSNRLKTVLNKFAGKEIAIWISIWFVLMSLLMLFANNFKVENNNTGTNAIHAAADIPPPPPMPWIVE